MVNRPLPTAAEGERALVLRYAPGERRAGLAALLALDARLGDVLRTTREPMIGQLRLTWWHEALATLDPVAPPAEPVLQGLARDAVTAGVSGPSLAAMIDGWEVLLDQPAPDEDGLAAYAAGRGGLLFASAARLLDAADERVERVGQGWALADLAAHLGDRAAAARAAAMARERLTALSGPRWPRQLRPLAALGLLARSDINGGTPGSPVRIARLLAMRLTGR